MGSVFLPHLRRGWHVDQAILSEEERLVVILFGRDSDPDCMRMGEVCFTPSLTTILYYPQILTGNTILGPLQDLRTRSKFCRHLRLRYRPGSRLQRNVRALRPMYDPLLLAKQAHALRFRYR